MADNGRNGYYDSGKLKEETLKKYFSLKFHLMPCHVVCHVAMLVTEGITSGTLDHA